LAGGKRVYKSSPRIEAYGTVDELNSFIACLLDEINDREDQAVLLHIQHDLFTVGGYLATEEGKKTYPVRREEVDWLEGEIDKIDELIPPLNSFVLPGGCRGNSVSHLCRTVCRRAERNIYKVAEQEEVDAIVLKYINRLSDYFFLLARKQNFINNIDEIIWEKPGR
jgi:cob(I)alamin adenosyltransferase